MAQATQSYQPQIDWQAVRILAKLAALRAVKRQIQAEGRVKVSLIPRGPLDALAKKYLKAHPELVQEAMASSGHMVSALSGNTRPSPIPKAKAAMGCARKLDGLNPSD